MRDLVRATLLTIWGVLPLLALPLSGSVRAQLLADSFAVVVHVMDVNGGPLTTQALVKLSSNGSGGVQAAISYRDGIATIGRVASGDYTIEVSASGYDTVRENVSVSRSIKEFFISLRPSGEGSSQAYPVVPLLTGKSKKEMDAAIAALESNQVAAASAHIANALKSAPAHPDVQYVAALCAVASEDQAGAKQHYEAAINLYPKHFGALVGLGALLLQQRDSGGAIVNLEKALTINPNAWRAHWLLAEAYLLPASEPAKAGTGSKTADSANLPNPAKAKAHATRAMELGGEKAADAQVTVARAEMMAGDGDAARARLEKFLQGHPQSSTAPRAEALLRRLAFPEDSTPPPDTGSLPITALDAASRTNITTNFASVVKLPPGVDDAIPPVDPSVSCALPAVLTGVGQRIMEFVEGLDRFIAREEVVHDELDPSGATRKTYQHTFQYLATVEHPTPNTIVLDEMRDGTTSLEHFPAPMAVEGLPAMGLVFHPKYVADFHFICEGLGQWSGQAAWQVHFEQRPDRPARIHDWVVQGQTYPTLLKGRAWISASTFRLLRIETDLAKPIPQIKLDYQHMAIDYQPVSFRNGATQLWLPAVAEVYSRYRGHFFRQEHDFSDFLLFSVDVLHGSSDSQNNP
jgi:Tfp pilus assembly protein PilF